MQVGRRDQIHFGGDHVFGIGLQQVTMTFFVAKSAYGDDVLAIWAKHGPCPSFLTLRIDPFNVNGTEHYLKIGPWYVVELGGVFGGAFAHGEQGLGGRVRVM